MNMYYMRDNHTFKHLSDDVETAIVEITTELDNGWTSGMLCSDDQRFVSVHACYKRPREWFLEDCRSALTAVASLPEALDK